MLAATGGAGASVALALSCAAAAAPAPVRLLDPSPAVRSGLTCAGERELGADGTGWLMAQRGALRIDRRASHDLLANPGRDDDEAAGRGAGGAPAGDTPENATGLPPDPRPPVPGEVVVVDQGTQDLGAWEAEARHGGRLVVVASSTPASLRAARWLAEGHHAPVLVVVHHHRAAAHPTRHPHLGRRGSPPGPQEEVWARVVDLRADGALRRTGLTDAPLPPRVAQAGHQVWDALVGLVKGGAGGTGAGLRGDRAAHADDLLAPQGLDQPTRRDFFLHTGAHDDR